MHIKTGPWDASSSACDSDGLCDPAVLVASAASQPHIRNRRLSPGSGGGGGGGGCLGGGDPQPQEPPYVPAHAHALAQRREKERRGGGGLQKGRGQRREGLRAGAGRGERAPQRPPKERWVEESLALLRPPPAFPVQDSPAKLLPAVSYASKVKAGPAAADEEPAAIGVLLQNQWGLSFISEARPAPEAPGPASEAPGPASEAPGPASEAPGPAPEAHIPEVPVVPVAPEAPGPTRGPAPPLAADQSCEPAPSVTSSAVPAVLLARPGPEEQNQARRLMLNYPHLVDALEYHCREWRSMCSRQKDSKRVVWYKDTVEQPA
ncbi:unnamed protein product [Boreogadus saida]